MRHLAATAVTLGGLTRLSRGLTRGRHSVLMFHGVRDHDDPRMLDHDLHIPADLLSSVFSHLARRAKVIPLASMVDALDQGMPLPEGAVALTFDDGYASNFELAYPLLMRFELPATIFPATGFLDGEDLLWFNRADYALANTRRQSLPAGAAENAAALPLGTREEKLSALRHVLTTAKALPQEQVAGFVAGLETALDARLRDCASLPDALRPLRWEDARGMLQSGLIEFGGHTHHHLILGRCRPETAAFQIALSRERIESGLDRRPRLFAYPNGGPGDFTAETAESLREHGFRAAVTTIPGRVSTSSGLFTLPRYGSPVSVADAEMTVSGCYETIRRLRRRPRRVSIPADRRPTVMHVIRSLGVGGAESMLCNLVETMKSGGWRTVLVSVISGDVGCQLERMRSQADAVYVLDDRPELRWRHLKRLRAIIGKEHPDVVQTWLHRLDLVAGAVARAAGCHRVVWGLHSLGLAASPGEHSLKLAVYRNALRIASKFLPRLIVSCSNAGIRTHEAAGYPADRMIWIPNGISVERFRPDPAGGVQTRRELGLPADAPVVGFVGRFHPVKGLAVWLRAAAQLQQQMPDAHFVLCGGGGDELDAEASAALRDMPARGQVRLIPFRDDPQRLYPALSIFSMSSFSEALPMVLLEAMACGVPCVASDVGDCAEVIGDTGRIVAPGNAEALSSAWRELLSLPVGEKRLLGRRARDRIVNRFSLEVVARTYESAYASLVDAA